MRTACAQEAVSRTNRSILQPEVEVQLPAGDMNAHDFMTGDWGGAR